MRFYYRCRTREVNMERQPAVVEYVGVKAPRFSFTRLGKALAFWVISVSLAVGVLEACAYLVIQVSDSFLRESIRRRATIYADQTSQVAAMLNTSVAERELLDRELGWMYRPGFRSATDHLNASGLRSLREYAPSAPAGRIRVAAFGDSFVYGNEVPDDSAWTAQVEGMDSAVEVLNYGVGGYGLDQAFLRYLREGGKYHPQLVVIGFVPDDLARLVNVYRRFIFSMDLPLIKPRFVLTSRGTLQLLAEHVPDAQGYRAYIEEPSRVRDLGKLDHWYEPLIYDNPLYDWSATVRVFSNAWVRLGRRVWDANRMVADDRFNERSEAFRIQVTLMEAFAKAVSERGAQSLVVFFPDRPSATRAVAGEAPVYAPLVRVLQSKGISTLDLAPEFANAAGNKRPDDWFMPGGHYSDAGNRVAARTILRAVRQFNREQAVGAGITTRGASPSRTAL
jgi:hypothetical protein